MGTFFSDKIDTDLLSQNHMHYKDFKNFLKENIIKQVENPANNVKQISSVAAVAQTPLYPALATMTAQSTGLTTTNELIQSGINLAAIIMLDKKVKGIVIKLANVITGSCLLNINTNTLENPPKVIPTNAAVIKTTKKPLIPDFGNAPNNNPANSNIKACKITVVIVLKT